MTTPLPSAPGRVTYAFRGPVGQRLHAVIDHWLLLAPQANPAMLEMFADRDVPPYRNLVPWAGEFAGKHLTGAVQVLRATGDPRLREQLSAFAGRLIALQDASGYLGPWPAGHHLTGTAPNTMGGGGTWDAWGHYHVMLGLMLWADETGDTDALSAASRIGDLFCDRFLGSPEIRLVDTGETDKNLAPAHALAMLHARTGEVRYLALAEQLVDEFAALGPDGPLAGDWYRLALAGREFYASPKPRWESLHPIMALAELARLTGNAGYRRAFEHIWWSIVRHDRHNNGGFSSGEKATGNPYDPAPIETCCTIAWSALSVEMLKLTGDARVADELELTLLNSALGMHAVSGRWATYNTPSDGARIAGAHQIVFQARPGSPELNCCSVNAPRGLGLLSEWAVMRSAKDVVTLNYYGPATVTVPLDADLALTLTQETDYPVDGAVRISVAPSRPADFELRLRVPAWSCHSSCAVNGKPVPAVEPGTYLPLARCWAAGDTIELRLDMRIRRWDGERECAGLTSLYRGPILLAYDPRYNRQLAQALAAEAGDLPPVEADPWTSSAGPLPAPTIDLASVGADPVAWRDWLPPVLLLKAATPDGQPVRLCDFAGAGQTGTLYRSWLRLSEKARKR